MGKLKGAVGIVNVKDDPSLDCLKGDIIVSSKQNDGLYSVKLRGALPETVVRLPKQNLVKLKDDGESLRAALIKVADAHPSALHLKQRLVTMQLEDEFSYLVKRHTNQIGFDPLPEHEANEALVRFIQAYYSGGGCISTSGRKLTSFYKALSPFYTDLGQGRMSVLFTDTTSGEMMDWFLEQFEKTETFDALFVVKAFAFVQHRLDFGEESDSLIDAFCVSMYLITMLQRYNDDGVIQEIFWKYGSKEVTLDENRVLWCFCSVFLKLAIRARDRLDERQYNLLFPDPLGITIAEQIKVAEQIVRLRPDCPASHLAAYVALMDTKDFESLAQIREDYMKSAYQRAVAGKEVADQLGDPFFKYMFHMIVAYWLPTSECESTCTVAEIRERVWRANDFRDECESYVPSFLFFQGKQHEGACKAALNAFQLPDDMVVPKMNAYLYSSGRFDDKYYKSNGKYDQLAERYKCANCSAMLLKSRACARCGQVFYCSKACQTEHWRSSHRQSCLKKNAGSTKK